MSDPNEPNYTLLHTGQVIEPIVKDIENLRTEPGLSFAYHPLFWEGAPGEKIYRPPGIWCDMKVNRFEAGARLLFLFPPPYHPVEVLAAYRGLGGVKAESGPPTDAEYAHVQRLNAIRWNGWEAWTAELARALILYPAQVRVLYHLFTPLLTNGVEPETSATLRAMSDRLFQAALGENDYAYASVDRAWAWRKGLAGRDMPIRMNFWGGEVSGRVAL